MTLLLYVAFVLSGAAGLMYEAIWSRYLGLLLGHGAYAQVVVLVIFLGGMSAGALAVGRRAERIARPLQWYAVAELAVGLGGMLFHDVFVAVTGWAYASLLPSLGEGWSVTAAKWLLAALLVLPQSVLLGTTFPLMSAGVLRRGGATGRTLALLYFANSIGASAGVLVAGFWLVAAVGLPGTLAVAGAVNLVVALAVGVAEGASVQRWRWAAAWGAPPEHHDATSGPSPRHPADAVAPVSPPGPRPSRALASLLLAAAFGTAVASFAYEIAWIRMLSFVLGSATHAFELMLSAFILGLALGALWVHGRADRFRRPLVALGVLQWAMGLLAVATLPAYLGAFRVVAALLEALAPTDAGYAGFTAGRYAIALAVMLPATFCAGTTLPLITKILLRAGAGERAIGTVYGVNTLGSIAGVALAALVVLPWLGVEMLLVAGAVLDIAIGAWLLARAASAPAAADGGRLASAPPAEARRIGLGALAAGVALVAVLSWGASLDRALLSSGGFRSGELPRPGADSVLFHADGRTATVTVRRRVAGGGLTIATNGKPDASVSGDWLRAPSPERRRSLAGDQSTQLLLPLVTLAHAPRARVAAVVGQGSGISSHVLLGSPHLRRLVTIDIEPEMIRGSRHFLPANRRVFDDPRSTFAIDDARSYLAAGRRRYDLVLSEPSNPWVSGVSDLFTVEFYERVREHLAPGGVLGQWLHLYELDDPLVMGVIAAVHAVFPSYEIYQVASHDLLIVAGADAELAAPDWSVLAYAGIAEDLTGIPLGAGDLDALRLVGRGALTPLFATGTLGVVPNSDFRPSLDLGAERARFLGAQADGLTGLAEARLDIVAARERRRRGFAEAGPPAVEQIDRLRARARGARLRAASAPTDSLGEADRTSRFAVETFLRSLEPGAPPSDWRLWTRAAGSAEELLHAGTAGVADEAFYDAVERYLDTARAPEPARAAIALLHGSATWDWSAVRAAAPRLLDAAARGEAWLPPEQLRDAIVLARLDAGDAAGARAALHALAPHIAVRGPSVFRAALLSSWIARP